MGLFLNRGTQEFERVLNSEIYVDKTDILAFLNSVIDTEQSYVCVSRPRRFGKSVTANMIASYYERGSDSAYLFEGKKLSQASDWKKYLNQYDVIRIDLAEIRSVCSSGNDTLDYIEKNIISELLEEFPKTDIVEGDGIAGTLARINQRYGNRFIIIIDEWDCFFREDKQEDKIQQRYINLLRSLFKGNRAKSFISLAYITGILPIKRYDSESALNNFYEYTMTSPQMLSQYIGFTENEVKQLCEKYHMDYKEVMDWYDGYSFENCQHIYGPNSVVRAMLGKNARITGPEQRHLLRCFPILP